MTEPELLMQRRVDDVLSRGMFTPDRHSLEKHPVPDWYRNGKFGIFIHWGVYAVPAFGNEWYPRNMYQPGSREFEHHVKTYGPQTQFGYKDFIPLFKAEQFDPAAWAKLFRKSGAKFVVPVAEHHDGFAMYRTTLNRWNAFDMGPRCDLIGELATAIRNEQLIFGLSSHRAEHYWFFDGGIRFPSDVQDSRFADLYGACGLPNSHMAEPLHHKFHMFPPTREQQQDWLLRTCELVDLYQPQIVWFDWWINNVAYRRVLGEFAAYYYSRASEWCDGGAINYKFTAYSPDCAVFDIERGQLDAIYPQFWQNDTSVSKNSWGYIRDHDYKRASDVIADLVDIVSKNGALLLNIGPRPDGTIPDEEQRMLLEIGEWLALNGEAIYDTRPWMLFGEGPTKVAAGSFSDTARTAFTHEDIRFTTAPGNVLYAIALARPADGRITIRALGTETNTGPQRIARVECPGCGEVAFQRHADRLDIQLPPAEPSALPVVMKINWE